MALKRQLLKILIFCSKLLFLLSLLSCVSEPQYIIFKTGIREQLKERALRYCHGDFKILEEEDFGPYTRARVQCLK